jgi:hypothetical protein
MDQDQNTVFDIFRIDRVTNDRFPVQAGLTRLQQAEEYAQRETRARAPMGDKFVVLDTAGEVVFDPELRH